MKKTLTVEKILLNTSNTELYKLFTEYTDRLVEQVKDAGVLCVDDDEDIFTVDDKKKVIKDMKKWGWK